MAIRYRARMKSILAGAVTNAESLLDKCKKALVLSGLILRKATTDLVTRLALQLLDYDRLEAMRG
jgi:hypothetical protein